MSEVIPPKLKKGDLIRVIAPSLSLSLITQQSREIAQEHFDQLGLKLSFGNHAEEKDDFSSSNIISRIADLHDALQDDSVAAILSAIGGSNCNQLLQYINWDLFRQHPKILCGYSDTTVLQNAILAKSEIVTYSGPDYAVFGQKLYLELALSYFEKCLMSEAPYFLIPSAEWSEDLWYLDQENRNLQVNDGYYVIHEGVAEGRIVGGNLKTFNLLQGTEFFPQLSGAVVFIEENEESDASTFDRDLQSLLHQSQFSGVKGLVIGRFQKKSGITLDFLKKIINTKAELENLPIVANVDFGHTDPKITFPIGGKVVLQVSKHGTVIEIVTH
jgi:muramoyltetrapeptide carboxypeptidase